MSDATCRHCTTPLRTPTERERGFCCSGCEFVHDLLAAEGLEHFYDLKGERLSAPIENRAFEKPDEVWLQEVFAKSHQTQGPSQATFHVAGVSCVGCVWLIEKLFDDQPGATRLDLFAQDGRLRLQWEPPFDLLAFARQLARFGYQLEPPGQAPPTTSSLAVRLGLCGGLAMNAMAFTLPRYLGMKEDFEFSGLFELITFASASASLLIGGSYFFTRAWQGLRRGLLHLDVPISLGLICAWLGSLYGWLTYHPDLLYFDFVAIFTFLMLAGRHLHQLAGRRAQSQVRQRAPLAPTFQTPEGEKIARENLRAGLTLELPPAERLPVTSRLLSPHATCSLAWINGESTPLDFRQGQEIPAGAQLLNAQPCQVHTLQDWEGSLPEQLLAESSSPPSSRRLDLLLRTYLALVVVLALSGAAWWGHHHGLAPALQVLISILVVSCPCALGVALPLLDQRASHAVTHRGVFLRRPRTWEVLPRIKRLLLDKTGTLTFQHPRLQNPQALHALTPEQRHLLTTLVESSLHPISRTLTEELAFQNRQSPPSSTPSPPPVQEIPGEGLTLEKNGLRWFLGRPTQSGDTTAAEFRCGPQTLALFTFEEALRPAAAHAIHHLGQPVELHLLSGDQKPAVARMAQALDIPPDCAHGELRPEEKATLATQLSDQPTLYLGDGANDALAFQQAHLTATPVAERSLLDARADFLFASRGLDFLPTLFAVARWRERTMHVLLTFAVLYNLLAVTLCFLGKMNPLWAAILMPLSSLISLLIASRQLPPAAGSPPEAEAG